MLRNLEALLCVKVNTGWRRGLHVGHFVEIFLINLCHFKKNDIYCAKKLWHFSGFPIGTGMDGMGRISVEETVVEGEDRGDMGVPSLQRKLAVSSL